MAYLLPSFFQKRILRYALSRLELLDTDALDLEKLDIEWGRRSTVELRDVGIHTKRLAALLHLPRSLAIISAQILFLRLTVPADLYKSGILVEVQGIQVCVNADLDEQGQGHDGRAKAYRSLREKPSRDIRADNSKSNQSQVHDPGGSPSFHTSSTAKEDEDELLAQIPTTVDLAKSFLQAEPRHESAELQASVPKSQNLDQSQTSSDDGEEASNVGIGNNLPLPAFLAEFLKGVGDRIHLKVKDVELDLTLRVDRPSDSSSNSDASDRSERVTIRLSTEAICVDGVTKSEATTKGVDGMEGPMLGMQETRRIKLTNLEIMLISEASLFANLARSTGPSSPETTHTNNMVKSRSKSNSASTSNASPDVDPFSSALDTSTFAQDSQEIESPINHDHSERPLVPEITDNKRRQSSAHDQTVKQSEYHDSILADSFYSSEVHNQDGQEPLRDSENLPNSVSYSDTVHYMDSTESPARSRNQPSGGSLHRAETPPLSFDVFAPTLAQTEISGACHASDSQDPQGLSTPPSRRGATGGASRSSNPASDRSSPISEDLAQSKVFTHEEASMYMSAISHVSDGRKGRNISVPGDWDSSDSEQEEKTTAVVGEDPTLKGRGNDVLHQPHIPNDSLRLDEYHSGQNAHVSGVSEAGPFGKSIASSPPSPTLAQLEPESSTASRKQENASSQGSEASSANFKSSCTTVKRIISVDAVVLILPQRSSNALDTAPEPQGTGSAVHTQGIPGDYGQDSFDHSLINSAKATNTSKVRDNQKLCRSCFIDVGTIQVLGDMGLTKMFILITQQLNALLKTWPAKTNKAVTLKSSATDKGEWKVTIKKVSWRFFDVVKGTPFKRGLSEQPSMISSAEYEILLKANVENVRAVHENLGLSSTTKLSIGKVSFGYSSDEILSFNPSLKMRESTRDILAPIDVDIVLTVTQIGETIKIDLTTLPLHVALDLPRLDETFSWFGGFSSMLGLGSSMMSTMTVVDAKSKAPHLGKATRGVHFESSISSRSTQLASAQILSKVTARIGGLVFDLQGTQCSLRFESTAMKLVSRMEGLGLQVDRLNFSGPFLKQAACEPAIRVKLANIRVEYLSTPKEIDLARLLAVLSPSRDKYARDDDILLDTLLNQRQQGAVLRATVESLEGHISNLDDLQCFPTLVEDLKKLSTMTKYLPDDDRPGMLTLGLIRDLRLEVTFNSSFGMAGLECRSVEVGHVTFPSLIALGISTIRLHRNHTEELLGEAISSEIDNESHLPTVMARFIGNEMDPTAKIKIHNLRVEYHVSTAMSIMGLDDTSGRDAMVAEMVNSVATLASRHTGNVSPSKLSNQDSPGSDNTTTSSKTLKLDIALRDSIIGLNPRNSSAKGLIVLTDTHILGAVSRDEEANGACEIRKASMMVIDDFGNAIPNDKARNRKSLDSQRSQIEYLSDLGYVSVGLVSAAKATVQIVEQKTEPSRVVDIEIRDDLFILETCADSTQTLQSILNGLKPPAPPSTELKYRTEVVPVEDMLASFTGDAFLTTKSGSADDDLPLGLDEGDLVDDEVPQNLEFVSSFYNPEPDAVYDGIADSMLEDDLEFLASPSMVREIGDKNLLGSFQDQAQVAPRNAPLDFQDDHFGASSTVGGTAHRWNTHQNTYRLSNDYELHGSPVRVRVRDVHIIWNLFDGYDWQKTRDAVSKAVEDVQIKATERLSRKDKRKSFDPEEEEESVIGDFLFNSIYIGIPANRDPRDLTRQVNRNLDDLASEPESYATSTTSGSPSRQSPASRLKGKRLRLKRSQYHKMTFELKGISADVVVFPPDSGETQSSIDIRIQDLEIFDHVPTSTWKKLATYMHDAGERESGTSMIHLEILNVKPIPSLAASEIILKATILPLRLHVDQDALDFMTRFFEFKDDAAPAHTSRSEAPFLQRVEVNSVRVKLDFKPKRIDYAGIRSGHTTEFMNFFILDRADMVLRHAIIYGVAGFDKLGKTLNDIWMPDIKRNQLPGILAGLAPVRSLVNVGGGVRDLVIVPIREYRKDGRVVRSFQKGAFAFAKTTTNELVKLGAKLAIGTQTVLQGAEDLLTQPSVRGLEVAGGWEDAELDEEEKKQISLYADQPVGVVQGLRGGYASLERDLLTAKDAIVAMPGEILESRTAGGAAKAVLRIAPTVILRPAVGVTKAVGQTLMGATNSLDPGNRRRIEDKYKRH